MRTKFVCILALVLTLSLSAAAVQRLTKGGIAKMVDKMTRAAQERNVEQLMKHFAPEAVITLHTEGRKLVMSPRRVSCQPGQRVEAGPSIDS